MATVSVLVRNRNEAAGLRNVLTRIKGQHTQPSDIVVVDNDSTDHSRSVIAELGGTLVHLPAGQFSYGRATNVGLEQARGELVLMLSAHSLPVGRYFIDEVCAPFSNAKVAAVRIPIAANTRELSTIGQLPALNQNSTARDIFGRGPVASGCVIRRSVWERFRIDEGLEAAEDKEWAMRVLRAGDWVMPVANACYVYDKTYSREAWLTKLQREERAGFTAAGLRRDTSWLDLVKTVVAGARDTVHAARTESALYLFRRGLR